MSATLRVLCIEARRSPGLWLFPVMLGLAWWAATVERESDKLVALWPDVSFGIRDSAALLGPVAGGLAAWMAGRSRRRGVDELLATTPYPAAGREASTLSGTLAWPGLSYALVAAALVGTTSLSATWGTPDVAVISVGLAAVGASGALGYAAGLYVHSRFTAPLLAVALFVGQFAGAIYAGPFQYLFPLDLNAPSVFYRVQPGVALLQLLWFLGLAGVALAAVVLKGRRSLMLWGAMLALLSVTAIGAGMVVRAGSASWRLEHYLEQRTAETITGAAFRVSSNSRQMGESVPYEPVCLERSIPVCVHPAYEAILPESADLADRLVAPLAGIPGGPRRAEQKEVDVRRTFLPDGTFTFSLYVAARTGNIWWAARDMAMGLVVDEAAMAARAIADGDSSWSMTAAQKVVADWLLVQAGVPLQGQVSLDGQAVPDAQAVMRVRSAVPGWASGPEEEAALERFTALGPDVRRAWLEENYTALRAGELPLEALP